MAPWLYLLATAAAWAQDAQPSVPSAPVALNRPAVIDTAHLEGSGTTVTLFGIKGWAGDPARGLQAFITDNGDRVKCQPHAGGVYVCTLPTGLDVAASALANGAAQTVADSPADYRAQEAAAQADHLGVWAALPDQPDEPTAAAGADAPPEPVSQQLQQAAPACCTALGDGDGITYDNGVPSALIGGEPVFFVFAGLAGWGFYDHGRHWHPAPEPFRLRLDAFRRDGRTPAGFRAAEPSPHWAAFHAPGFYGPGGLPTPSVFNGPGGSIGQAGRQTVQPMPGGMARFRQQAPQTPGSALFPSVVRPVFSRPLGAGNGPGRTIQPGTLPAATQRFGLVGGRSGFAPGIVPLQRPVQPTAVSRALPAAVAPARPGFGRR